MDLKKHALSDHFPCWASSPKGKVVSSFGLGIVVSLVVLSVVVLNISFKTPLFGPVFHGFNSTHVLPWPFSLSSTTFSSSSGNTSGARLSTNLTGTEMGKIKEGRVIDGTDKANVSEIDASGKNVGSKKEGVDLGKAHVGDLSENVQNGSFIVEEEKLQKQSHEQGTVWGTPHLRNFTEDAKNGKSIAAGGILGETIMEGKQIAKNGSSFAKHSVSTEDSDFGEVKVSDKQGVKSSEHDFHSTKVGNSSLEKCEIFDGRWVRDDTKPYYRPGSCPYIDKGFDCHVNGRPDDGFLKWKWQPYGCDIPSLNATDFLERLRGKKLVFVGDSLNRNMWESLVCILRHSVKDKNRIFEISGKTEFKKKGFYAFRFEDYNCSVDYVGSPFLVGESTFEGRNGSFETLRLDLMDQTTSMYHDADVIVFNTGHWWTHEKTSRGEDYYQEGNHVYPRLKVLDAYKRALLTWARWVDKNIDSNKTLVVFRGYSVTHFRGGQWNSGGQCHNETEPIFNQTYLAKYPSKMRALDNVLREMRTSIIYLNISRLTDYRKDGHPSIYRRKYNTVEEQIAAVNSQDCSHWCLPGVPDTWNELLYASLLKAGIGSWRT